MKVNMVELKDFVEAIPAIVEATGFNKFFDTTPENATAILLGSIIIGIIAIFLYDIIVKKERWTKSAIIKNFIIGPLVGLFSIGVAYAISVWYLILWFAVFKSLTPNFLYKSIVMISILYSIGVSLFIRKDQDFPFVRFILYSFVIFSWLVAFTTVVISFTEAGHPMLVLGIILLILMTLVIIYRKYLELIISDKDKVKNYVKGKKGMLKSKLIEFMKIDYRFRAFYGG